MVESFVFNVLKWYFLDIFQSVTLKHASQKIEIYQIHGDVTNLRDYIVMVLLMSNELKN